MSKGFIFFFLFTNILASWLYPVIPQAEGDALIALYNSTDGENYTTTGLNPVNSWTIPNTPLNNCLVRISDTSGPTTYASAAIFTIAVQKTITLSTPYGEENWEGGSSQNITWTYTGSIPKFKIEYSTDNGGSWNTVTDSTANTGSFSWMIPDTPSGNCLVLATDKSGPATNTSDSIFTIAQQRSVTVTSPNGGENWESVPHKPLPGPVQEIFKRSRKSTRQVMAARGTLFPIPPPTVAVIYAIFGVQ